MSLGLKVTVVASVAVSIGGVIATSLLLAVLGGLSMKNSITKLVSGWCGVALLRGTVEITPSIRESAPKLRWIASQEQRKGVRLPLPASIHLRCGMEEGAAPLGLADFWLGSPSHPPLTQWAKYCRASGALD